jgi:hypothetical protein
VDDLMGRLDDFRAAVDLTEVFDEASSKTACCSDLGQSVSE